MHSATALLDRLCRPQRIGILGHRGVGKTTLLTMLYREAVGGRLPHLRLAAGDAATANYLADKILQLEAGQVLPATLAETELRFQLYHHGTRIEILLRDYQGEHVQVGSQEGIRSFLRDCDAILVCLDPVLLTDPAQALHAQQEVEQVIEDYLALEPLGGQNRPMALVLTKADLLPPPPRDDSPTEWLRTQVETRLGMTLHALRQHFPHNDLFAVSSLGSATQREKLHPDHLEEPLHWLVRVLQLQDEERLDLLFKEAPGELALLHKAVACFVHRYPQALMTTIFQRRLRERRAQRRRRRLFAGLAAGTLAFLGLWAHDRLGQQRLEQFEREHEDPAARRVQWQEFQRWHPTRFWLTSLTPHQEGDQLRRLDEEVREQRALARLVELRRLASAPEADVEEVWAQFLQFHKEYPQYPLNGDEERLRNTVRKRRDEAVARRAQIAYEALLATEQHLSGDNPLVRRKRLELLVTQADSFLREFPGLPQESAVRTQREKFLERIDELDFEGAQSYSSANPLNFQTRRERYLTYLEQHPQGAHVQQAAEALAAIERDWDRHDFRPVYDLWKEKPSDLKELTARCQHYLLVHRNGRYYQHALELLHWAEQICSEREYKVVLKQGSFDKGIARWLSRGPDLSVEIEVGGVKYGPSQVIGNNYTPEWNYEFPRPVRWKLGDPVIIRVSDHDYWKKVVVEINSGEDPLGMNLLSTSVTSGANSLVFESDFRMPTLPALD